MSINWEMDKQMIAYSHSGIQINNKKKRTIDIPNSMDESQNHYAKWKEPEFPQPNKTERKRIRTVGFYLFKIQKVQANL